MIMKSFFLHLSLLMSPLLIYGKHINKISLPVPSDDIALNSTGMYIITFKLY
jgi:hypothetical protein